MFVAPREITWREWSGLAAGVVAFAATFLPWTVLTADNSEIAGDLRDLPASDVARSAWNSDFFSWCPPIILLLTGLVVVLFGQKPTARDGGLPQVWLIGASLGVVLTVIGWYLIELQFSDDERGLFETAGISVNAGFGRYLGVLAAVASVVLAVLDTLAARAERRAPKPKRPKKKAGK